MASNDAEMDSCIKSSEFKFHWSLFRQNYNYWPVHILGPNFITWKTRLIREGEPEEEGIILSIVMKNGKSLTTNILVYGKVTVTDDHDNVTAKELCPSFLPKSTGIKHTIWRVEGLFPKDLQVGDRFVGYIEVKLILAIFERKNPLDQISPPVSAALTKDYLALFKSKSFSDVVLVAENQEFQAHKAVLSARSPVFAAMFASEMKENLENRVKIEDFSPRILETFLQFVYSGCYESSEEDSQEMFVIAEKYQVEDLKTAAMLDLCNSINLETVDERLILAKQFNQRELRNLCYDFFKVNCAKLQEM